MIIRAMHDEPLPVYGDGRNVRDWLHVDDHAAAIDLVLRHGKDGEIYNVGGNNEHRNIDIVKRILQILGKPETLITHVTDRLGHDYRYAIDADKIKHELGWKPKHSFETGIAATIEWYTSNTEWWKKLVDKS